MLPLTTFIQPLKSDSDQLPVAYEDVKATSALGKGSVTVRTSGASTIESGVPTNAANVVGVYIGAERSASDTGTPAKPVVAPRKGTQFVFPVEAGAATAIDNGDIIGLESATGVDLSDTTNAVVIFQGVYAYDQSTGNPSHIVGEFNI